MNALSLSWKSLGNRRFTVMLTVLSVAASVVLLIGVERIRREARESFTSTISGTDLIVGARTSSVQLLLATVFRIGDTTNTVRWESFEKISSHPAVAWSIPISLGDSHRGFRVLGTTSAYLDHLRYGRKQALKMTEGTWFENEHSAVLGSEVAAGLGYGVGTTLVVTHGTGDVSFVEHGEHPFSVTGILAPTGTPVDRAIHVDLSGMHEIHQGMSADHGDDMDPLASVLEGQHEYHRHNEAKKISAFFIGLKSRSAALGVQRLVNEYGEEPLSAVLPALALQQLWEIVGVVEKVLLVVSAFVVLVGLTVMLVAILTSLDNRRREMAILRSVGARPVHIFGLIVGEATLVTVVGVALGLVLLNAILVVAGPTLAVRMGLYIEVGLSLHELALVAIVTGAGLLMGLLPAYRSYRYSLADGLTVRV